MFEIYIIVLSNSTLLAIPEIVLMPKPERIFHSDADGIKLLTVVAVPEASVTGVGPCRVIHIPNSLILESGNFHVKPTLENSVRNLCLVRT